LPGDTIQHELLPFDIEVVKYLPNSSEPGPAKPGLDNPATAGDGVAFLVQPRDAVSGTNSEETDFPSAYVTFKEKGTGKSLGTYLVSLWFSYPLAPSRPQHLKYNGKTYDISLRYQRTYKPYTFHLKEFHHDVYEGTTIPKNYSSLVHLVDPVNNDNREV